MRGYAPTSDVPLNRHIEAGDIDPTVIVTHRVPLSEAPDGYAMFNAKRDGCIKVVLHPH